MLVFWFVCFVVLFAATEFYRWLIHLIGIDMTGFNFAELPLPVYILAGVALAIASNYSKQTDQPFQDSAPSPPAPPTTASPPLTSEASAQSTSANSPRSLTATSAPKVHVQSTTPQPQNNASTVSYTIDKDNHRSERRPKSP